MCGDPAQPDFDVLEGLASLVELQHELEEAARAVKDHALDHLDLYLEAYEARQRRETPWLAR